MKKKLMMVAVLLGALSLGACVDNDESASVEAVRMAKAKQLESLANINNADADAKKAITAAEVAIKEAEAAYKKAQAELEQAQADQQKILLEKAQAALEAELETAKINAEAQLNSAKASLETAKAALIAALDGVDQANKTRITTLLGKANGLLVTINQDRTDLIDAKNGLARLKAELVTVELSNQETIAKEEKNKAVAQALIAEYEKYSTKDKADAEKAAQEANAKLTALNQISNEKYTANKNAIQAFNEANTNLNGSLYMQTIYRLTSNYYVQDFIEGENVNYTNDDATTGSAYSRGYYKYTANIDAINKEITDQTRNLSVNKAALADANKALTDAKAADAYKNLTKAVTDAQKKFDDAKTEVDKNTALNELRIAEGNLRDYVKPLETAVESATTGVTNSEENLKSWNDILAGVSGDNATAYATLITAMDNAVKAQLETQIAYNKASHNYSVQNSLAYTLQSIADGLADYDQLILAQKQAIAAADENIANAASIVSKEQAIANKEKEIADLENSLAVNEPIYNDYLAQIKALVGDSAE
ncbi:hypothetical protein [Bacteroides fragilis]|uniref:hypothetical protein n=1 Tax=Bacteroides fragilis TaxID=817 RepID=UPI001C707BFE|nr:hypothetical protein [Bacteroides fragilis]MBW9277544.1 hypothetical protein [Bacteroides fragilis]